MDTIILQIGVKAFLKNPEGKYLLLRRSKEKYSEVKGDWDIPGGRIDAGQSLLDNLKREIKEETGLDLTETPQLVAAQDILRVPGRHVVRLTYFGAISGEPKLDTSENVEYRWFTLGEIKALGDLDIYFKEVFHKNF